MMGIDTDAVIEQAKENSRNVYYTGYIPDDRLLADLDSHGVKYSTPIQHNSPILDFFLMEMDIAGSYLFTVLYFDAFNVEENRRWRRNYGNRSVQRKDV